MLSNSKEIFGLSECVSNWKLFMKYVHVMIFLQVMMNGNGGKI